MRWLLGILVALVLFAIPVKAHEDKYLCHHYYYEGGLLVIVPVFHDWDHPHAIWGISFVHVPHVHHVHVHKIHGYWGGGVHHFKGHGFKAGVRHFYSGH